MGIVRTQSIKTEDGFGLVEAMCALLVLSMGFFSVMQMYAFGSAKVRAIQEHNWVTQALENEIETLRGAPFASLKPIEQREFLSTTPALSKLVRLNSWVSITETSDANAQLRETTVCVQWTTENGRRTDRRLTTLIADKGGAR